MGPLQRLRRGSGRVVTKHPETRGILAVRPPGTSTIRTLGEVCHLAAPTVQPRFPALSDFPVVQGTPESGGRPIGGDCGMWLQTGDGLVY